MRPSNRGGYNLGYMTKQQRILIVDDSEINRAILVGMLSKSYAYVEAENGEQAVSILQEDSSIDLVLLDLVMPGMDGFAVLSVMNEKHWIDTIPVIMISFQSDSTSVARCYQMGATDYISRPFEKAEVRQRIQNTLNLYARQKQLQQMVQEQLHQRTRSNLLIDILSHIVEFRNGEHMLHMQHMHALVDMLLHALAEKTEKYGLTDETISLIASASSLHDIGKIDIPGYILDKPGKLTEEEYAIVKAHAMKGAAMLAHMPPDTDGSLINMASDICRWHHERFDGKGYPDGLTGDAIPISAQAVGLADVYDALISERCYRPAYTPGRALEMILNGECGAFNPLLIDCLKELQPQIEKEFGLPTEKQTSEKKRMQSEVSSLLMDDTLPITLSTQQLLDQSRERSRFFAAQAGGLQFEYSAQHRALSLTDCDTTPSYENPTATQAEFARLSGLSHEDCMRLNTVIRNASPTNPDALFTTTDSECGMTDRKLISLHTFWTEESAPRFLGVVGQVSRCTATEGHHAALRLDLTNITRERIITLMMNLREYYDRIRLVDPATQEAYNLCADGTLAVSKRPCYALWGRTSVCENCVSCRAVANKNRITKLELVNNDIYQIISNYVVMDGRPMALELISLLDSGVLVGTENEEVFLKKFSRDYYTDRQTGAYNRQYYEDQRETLTNIDGVIMMDVNDFKAINDTYGHTVGDMALTEIAKTVLSTIRSTDRFIRFGGDEFLLIFPRIPHEVFVRQMKHIQDKVSRILIPEYPEIHLSISIGGVYRAPTLMDAVRQADQAMYRDKAQKGMLRF